MRIRKGLLGQVLNSALLAASLVVIISGEALIAQSLRADRPQSLLPRSYFPLKSGYRWVYVLGRPGTGPVWDVTVEADESGQVSNSYRLLRYLSSESGPVCLTASGDVVERGHDGKDHLWYQFNAPVGKTWVMDVASDNPLPCADGATAWIGARAETVSVPAGQFMNVIRIDYIPAGFDCGIWREWFAPGVGLIRREENSFGGNMVTELVYAELGERVLPESVYSTSLRLSSAQYLHNLTPPVDPSRLARLEGSLVVRNETEAPAELVFPDSCRRVRLEVRDEVGKLVIQTTTQPDLGCFTEITRVDPGKQALVVPFSLLLADQDGKPLPDGSYTLTVVLLTVPETLRPLVCAPFQISSQD